MNIQRLGLVVLLSLMSSAGVLSRSYGCGLDWDLPTTHFEGVNEQGYVAYWENVGKIDLGDGLRLPITIGFRSNKDDVSSPYLGKGWIIPLLESTLVQLNENKFVMMQPDGWTSSFIRYKNDDNILFGPAGWMAEIRDNTVTAWAPCGWKVEFSKGHLTSMTTPTNRKVEFVYSGGHVTEIREGGASVFSVESDHVSGEVKALRFGKTRMEISLDQKPSVQSIVGQCVINHIDRSLQSLSSGEGLSKTFEYSVNDKLQPTLKITKKDGGERLFTWDPSTKQIISDNDWKYLFKSTPSLAVATQRFNAGGQSEYWLYDGPGGREIVQSLDGEKTVKTWFTSGKIAGRVRKIESIRNDVSTGVYSAAYLEDGKFARQVFPNGTDMRYLYDEAGRLVSKKVFLQDKLQQNISFEYRPNNEVKITIASPEGVASRVYDDTGGLKGAYASNSSMSH